MILRAPHPALSAISDECTEDDKWLITELMSHFHVDTKKGFVDSNAAAIAAPQIGYNKRLFVFRSGMVFINPVVQSAVGLEVKAEECLSVGGRYLVTRMQEIQFSALNEDFERKQYYCYGIIARLVQHEWDHLDGILISDIGTKLA